MSGKKTLLVDLDPQCNATSGLGCQPAFRHPLLQDSSLQDAATATGIRNLWVLPGSRSSIDLAQLSSGAADLCQQAIDRMSVGARFFDYTILDCPPSVGPLTRTALTISNEILMPIQCEYFAMEGLTQMIQVIRDVIRLKSGQLEFSGILLTMHDDSLELTYEVEDQVRDFFGEIVFETVIPRDVAVSEAPSHGRSVLDYSPRSRGSRAYMELCMEVLEHG